MRACVRVVVSAWVLAIALGRAGAAAKAVDGAVNLNTAPPEILALLPGIGPAKAESILAYRKRHPFRTVDELVRIKGIGRKMVRRLRGHLAVGGPTTATASAVASAATAPITIPHAAPPPPRPGPPICRPAARPPRPGARAAWPSHGTCPRAP